MYGAINDPEPAVLIPTTIVAIDPPFAPMASRAIEIMARRARSARISARAIRSFEFGNDRQYSLDDPSLGSELGRRDRSL